MLSRVGAETDASNSHRELFPRYEAARKSGCRRENLLLFGGLAGWLGMDGRLSS